MSGLQLPQVANSHRVHLAVHQIENIPRQRTEDSRKFPLVEAIRNVGQHDGNKTSFCLSPETLDPQKVIPSPNIAALKCKNLEHHVARAVQKSVHQPKMHIKLKINYEGPIKMTQRDIWDDRQK